MRRGFPPVTLSRVTDARKMSRSSHTGVALVAAALAMCVSAALPPEPARAAKAGVDASDYREVLQGLVGRSCAYGDIEGVAELTVGAEGEHRILGTGRDFVHIGSSGDETFVPFSRLRLTIVIGR